MSRTIQYLHRCLKNKRPLCRDQYNIYTDAWKQKTLCSGINTEAVSAIFLYSQSWVFDEIRKFWRKTCIVFFHSAFLLSTCLFNIFNLLPFSCKSHAIDNTLYLISFLQVLRVSVSQFVLLCKSPQCHGFGNGSDFLPISFYIR